MEGIKEQIKFFWNLPIAYKAFYYLLFLTFGSSFFLYLRPIINAAGLSGSTDNIFILLWIIGIYFSFSLFIKSIRLIDIVLYFAISAFYFYSPVIYPITRYFVNNTFFIFTFQTFPVYFLGITIDFQRDKSALSFISKAQLLLTAFFIFLSLFNLINTSVRGEQMWLSYTLLFPTMFVYYTYTNTKKIFDLLFFLLGVSLILMLGTRGPLICLMFFLLAFLFQNYKHNTVLTINLLIALGAFSIFLRPIVIILMFLTRMVGMSPRIFESYLEDNLLNYEKSSGRNDIHELLWNHIINDRGGIGYGLGSDRIMGLTGTMYAHNLVYEIWMDFGIYIGSLLILLFIIFIVKTFKKVFDSDQFNFVLILFVWSVGHLLLSGSYLHDFQIYFFLGVCANILRTSVIEEKEDDETIYFVSS